MRPDRQTRANTFLCRPRVWEGGEAPSGGVGGKTSQEETTARVSLPMAFGVMVGGSWLTSLTSVWRVHVLNGPVPMPAILRKSISESLLMSQSSTCYIPKPRSRGQSNRVAHEQ